MRPTSPSNPERAAALTELAGLPGILKVLSRDEAVALIEPGDTPAGKPNARSDGIAGDRRGKATATIAT